MAASSGNGGGMSSVIGVLTNIDQHLSALIDRIRESRSSMEVPGSTSSGGARGFLGSITVQIAKLADTINVRSEDDIDEMADKVAKKFVEVIVNKMCIRDRAAGAENGNQEKASAFKDFLDGLFGTKQEKKETGARCV